MTVETESKIIGCLVGGAVGDALGAPVELSTWRQIVEEVGERGITTVRPPGHFTDDTQMSLFTCQALIRAALELDAVGVCDPVRLLYDSYLVWLVTQGASFDEVRRAEGPLQPAGWLVHEPAMRRRNAPGTTCVGALKSGVMGTLRSPINDAKGCGGVTRAAPAGLLTPGAAPGTAPAEAYHLGCEVAAITHGHPDGILPAGMLAALIHVIVAGATVPEALETCLGLTSPALRRVIEHAMEVGSGGPPDPETLSLELGGGWVGEEALAIAVACTVRAPSFEAGVLAAVNHGGDSDSTGAIGGNLLGALEGAEAIPGHFVEAIDAIDLVWRVALDVARLVTDRPSATEFDPGFQDLFDRYVL